MSSSSMTANTRIHQPTLFSQICALPRVCGRAVSWLQPADTVGTFSAVFSRSHTIRGLQRPVSPGLVESVCLFFWNLPRDAGLKLVRRWLEHCKVQSCVVYNKNQSSGLNSEANNNDEKAFCMPTPIRRHSFYGGPPGGCSLFCSRQCRFHA